MGARCRAPPWRCTSSRQLPGGCCCWHSPQTPSSAGRCGLTGLCALGFLVTPFVADLSVRTEQYYDWNPCKVGKSTVCPAFDILQCMSIHHAYLILPCLSGCDTLCKDHWCADMQVDGAAERLLWSHSMAEQVARTLGVPSVQLLDAALVPPSGGGGPPSQAAVLAASTSAEAQVRACTPIWLMVQSGRHLWIAALVCDPSDCSTAALVYHLPPLLPEVIRMQLPGPIGCIPSSAALAVGGQEGGAFGATSQPETAAAL